MLTLNDWLVRKILTKVIKKAFWRKFGYELKLDLRNVSIEMNGDEVILGIAGTAKMRTDDVNKLIDEVI